MSINIDNIAPLLEPGWVAYDEDGRLIWFEEKPILKKICEMKFKNDGILVFPLDEMKDKPVATPDEEVCEKYVWSSKGSSEVISDSLKSSVFQVIEQPDDWKNSLRKVG